MWKSNLGLVNWDKVDPINQLILLSVVLLQKLCTLYTFFERFCFNWIWFFFLFLTSILYSTSFCFCGGHLLPGQDLNVISFPFHIFLIQVTTTSFFITLTSYNSFFLFTFFKGAFNQTRGTTILLRIVRLPKPRCTGNIATILYFRFIYKNNLKQFSCRFKLVS